MILFSHNFNNGFFSLNQLDRNGAIEINSFLFNGKISL